KYLDRFSTKLTNQLNSIEKLEPKHQQELLQLEDDLRKAESKYNENLAKYNNPNTSPTEKTKLMLLVNEALDDIERIKGKLKHNPLANLERYNYLDDLERLFAGNAPEPTNNPRGGREPGGSGSGENGNGQTPNPLEDPKSFFTQNKTMLVFVLGLVGLALYLFIQKDDEAKEDTKEDKKFMRQMAMMKKYQEDASIFPDGDRNRNFQFSRAASYEIFFPPALREYYNKGKENNEDCVVANPTRGKTDDDKKDNSAIFYGAPGTGKTATVKNVCVKANKYPLVGIKGSALTPTKEDQESKLLPLKKFVYTINLFIENNPEAQIETEENEVDEEGNETGEKVKADIEI
ncbi:17594_t:CDS:2, partial [Racocetra persica]